MKKFICMNLGMMVLIALAPMTGLAQHQHMPGPNESDSGVIVEGELVCFNCYRQENGPGADRVDCARKCYDRGEPLGILTPEGELYLLSPGGRETKVTKTADFAVQHAIMMVSIPVMIINEFTPYSADVPDFPAIRFKKKVKKPGKKMLGRKVWAKGSIERSEGIKTMRYSELNPEKLTQRQGRRTSYRHGGVINRRP